MIDSYGNEILEQQELFTNSWGINSGFKHLADQLNDLVPAQGRCENPMSKNKHLERFRKASNLTYDLFNNGLGNRRSEFNAFFGFLPLPSPRHCNYISSTRWDQIEEKMETLITPIILAAAKEQGVK